MISFDKHGNMQPYKLVSMDMQAIQKHLVQAFPGSKRRADMFLLFSEYQRDLFKTFKGISGQWMDGSFVSSKENPNDIDLVNIIPEEVFDTSPDGIAFFTIGGSDQTYGVDAHLIVDYPNTMQTQMRKDYFLKWFGHDRDGNPKGIVEVKPPAPKP